ncbi:MAG: hypothetical protein NC485_07505 [Ruminococcus flavefaciens]|nr:hypothetical protein [Ruminococcus flavefaciens]MCM1062366.1 hypothetical protein [Eubacterium sp.]
MSKNFLLNAMFQAIMDENPTDSKLNPYELNIKFDKILDQYLPDSKDDYDTRNDGEMEFIAIVYEYMENAFNTGFNTAIQLLMGGGAV